MMDNKKSWSQLRISSFIWTIHYLISLEGVSLGASTVAVFSLASTTSGTTIPAASRASLGSSVSGALLYHICKDYLLLSHRLFLPLIKHLPYHVRISRYR